MLKEIFYIFIATSFLTLPLNFVIGANPLDIVINEIAWSGTKASSSDEWIELFNNQNLDINLDGWSLYSGTSTLIIKLKGIIKTKSFYLIERTNDSAVSDITSDLFGPFGGSGLKNTGEDIILKDSTGQIIDAANFANGWPAGTASATYKTMERIDLRVSGNDLNNWATNNGIKINGRDAKGNNILGTPKFENSVFMVSLWDSTSTNSTTTATSTSASPTSTPQASSTDNSGNINYTSSQPQTGGAYINKPPIIELDDVTYVFVGDPLSFDITKIKDPEGDALTFNWNFGDGVSSNSPSHIYKFPGSYLILLKAKDAVNEVDYNILAKVYPKNLFVNEFFPITSKKDNETSWLELYNENSYPVDLSGFIIESGSKKFTIPPGTAIYSKSYLVFDADIMKISLNNKESSLNFLSPERYSLQEISYKNHKKDFAIARKGDDYFFTQIKTPGTKNIIFTDQILNSKTTNRVTVDNPNLFVYNKGNLHNINIAKIPGFSAQFNTGKILAKFPLKSDLDDILDVAKPKIVQAQDINSKINESSTLNNYFAPNNLIYLGLVLLGALIFSYLIAFKRKEYIELFYKFIKR